MKLTGPEVKYFYLCDKKEGACRWWSIRGWKKCESKECNYTEDPTHAKNKVGRKFDLIVYSDGSADRWEVEKE